MEMADIDFMFQKMRVDTGAQENDSTHILILDRAMFVGVADPKLIAVREIVEEPS